MHVVQNQGILDGTAGQLKNDDSFVGIALWFVSQESMRQTYVPSNRWLHDDYQIKTTSRLLMHAVEQSYVILDRARTSRHTYVRLSRSM